MLLNHVLGVLVQKGGSFTYLDERSLSPVLDSLMANCIAHEELFLLLLVHHPILPLEVVLLMVVPLLVLLALFFLMAAIGWCVYNL